MMTEKNIPLSQRESYTPTPFKEFLWWLATAEKELLADSVVDRNRYSIVGMTVLATWTFATMAWSYFFSTVINSLMIALLLGFFMGFVILTIDRALIKGINQFNRNKLVPLLFRALLAVTIGTFMAQPALLYMFDKEIKLQTSLDNEQKKMQKRQELDSLYSKRKAELITEKTTLQQAANTKYMDVSKARNNFLAETDGSGGSGKVGIKDIAMAKKKEYQKLDEDYQALQQYNQPKLASIDTELKTMEDNIKKEELRFTEYLNNGFLTRIEALNNLIKSNSALQFRYYLLIIILLLIELMPVIAKTLLPNGSYDEKVFLRERMEKELANTNTRKEQELKELYNQLALENDSEAIRSFFALTKDDRTEKMKAFSKRWKEEQHQSFDGLWEKMKKEIFTKQEH